MDRLPLRRQARLIATTLLCLFASSLGGCATMRTLDAGELETAAPVPLRVTLNDGSVVDLVSYVQASGIITGTGTIRARNVTIPFNGAIPRERIMLAQVPTSAPVLYALLGAFAAGAALFLIFEDNPVQYIID